MTTINQNEDLGKVTFDLANIPGKTKKVVEVIQTQHIIGVNNEVPVSHYYDFEAVPAIIEQLQRMYDEDKAQQA
jgi:hypothetical protein